MSELLLWFAMVAVVASVLCTGAGVPIMGLLLAMFAGGLSLIVYGLDE